MPIPVSVTTTVKLHFAWFPVLSLNTYSTGVEPILNLAYGSCDFDTVTVPDWSIANGSVHRTNEENERTIDGQL